MNPVSETDYQLPEAIVKWVRFIAAILGEQ